MANSERGEQQENLIDPSQSLVALSASVERFSGPLPPPALLAAYNDLIPNGAERIMAMAERQSAHRESLESRIVDGNVRNQTRGSYFAFVIVLISVVGGMYLLHEGRSISGLVAILASLGGLVGVFVYSKHEQRMEREKKSQAVQSRRRTER